MAISSPRPGSQMRRDTSGDGVEGNQRLTGLIGALLLAPLAFEGLTIVRIGQMLWLHMFVGLVLLAMIVLKLGSTGYRFLGYYGGRAGYVRKGPPVTPLRLLAVPVVVSSIAVLVTGVLLLLEGPGSRRPLVLIHKVSFIVWIAFTAMHVLAHLSDSYDAATAELGPLDTGTPRLGRRGIRLLALASSIVTGLIIALVALPEFSAWTH